MREIPTNTGHVVDYFYTEIRHCEETGKGRKGDEHWPQGEFFMVLKLDTEETGRGRNSGKHWTCDQLFFVTEIRHYDESGKREKLQPPLAV